MHLGGVLEFAGWRLSDACRHAELLGCCIDLAWLASGSVFIRARYNQRTANAIAKDAIAGTISIRPGQRTPEHDLNGLDMSTWISS
jgi:hypothetical protein